MNTTVLDNVMNISYPDGFRVLSAEETAQMTSYKEPPAWCIKDEERHIIIAVHWTEKKGFLGSLVSIDSVAKSMEKQMHKQMKPFGYRLDGFFSLKMGGEDAESYRYTYEVQGIGMTGEQLIARYDKKFYYIYSYYRTALSEESRKVLEDMISSVSWKGAC